jgi:LPXTG-site transpeptidase (sortase) family protein
MTQTVQSGGSAVAPTASRSGYNFDGWDRTFNNISSNITVTARWTAQPTQPPQPTPPQPPATPSEPQGGQSAPRANDSTPLFSFNYRFTSGPDYRFELGRPTPTDLLPLIPENANVRRNAGSAFNPPPTGMFSGNFPTDRNNPFANQSPGHTARETTNFSHFNIPGWGPAPSGWDTGNISGGNSGGGMFSGALQGSIAGLSDQGMLAPTSIMEGNNAPSPTAPQSTANAPQAREVNISHVPMTAQMPTPNLTSPQTAPQFFQDGSMGRLSIPAININNVSVRHGVGYDIIDRYIGHFPTTSAWDGNIGLASHNGGSAAPYFARIHELRLGDEIIFQTPFGTRVYEVAFSQMVSETDFELLGWSNENMITLVTCAGNVGGRQNQRLMIIAVEAVR